MMNLRWKWQSDITVPAKDVDESILEKYLSIASFHTFDGGRHQIRIQELEK
jgi:hypothetical protein